MNNADSFQMERVLRHVRAVHFSDFEHLKQCLLAAADRFEDVAALIEKGDGYDPVPFLRASAERYRGEVAALKIGRPDDEGVPSGQWRGHEAMRDPREPPPPEDDLGITRHGWRWPWERAHK